MKGTVMAGEAALTFIGNVGKKDPELNFMPNGDAVCSFSVAVKGRTKDGDGWKDKENPSWYKVKVWRKAGEAVAESVRAGSRVVVVGRLEIEQYEKDGTTRMVPTVTADAVGVVPMPPRNSQPKQNDDRDGSPW
jgi:single-strand DNA-binding protein